MKFCFQLIRFISSYFIFQTPLLFNERMNITIVTIGCRELQILPTLCSNRVSRCYIFFLSDLLLRLILPTSCSNRVSGRYIFFLSDLLARLTLLAFASSQAFMHNEGLFSDLYICKYGYLSRLTNPNCSLIIPRMDL